MIQRIYYYRPLLARHDRQQETSFNSAELYVWYDIRFLLIGNWFNMGNYIFASGHFQVDIGRSFSGLLRHFQNQSKRSYTTNCIGSKLIARLIEFMWETFSCANGMKNKTSYEMLASKKALHFITQCSQLKCLRSAVDITRWQRWNRFSTIK